MYSLLRLCVLLNRTGVEAYTAMERDLEHNSQTTMPSAMGYGQGNSIRAYPLFQYHLYSFAHLFSDCSAYLHFDGQHMPTVAHSHERTFEGKTINCAADLAGTRSISTGEFWICTGLPSLRCGALIYRQKTASCCREPGIPQIADSRRKSVKNDCRTATDGDSAFLIRKVNNSSAGSVPSAEFLCGLDLMFSRLFSIPHFKIVFGGGARFLRSSSPRLREATVLHKSAVISHSLELLRTLEPGPLWAGFWLTRVQE
jgi:hypothetical protein